MLMKPILSIHLLSAYFVALLLYSCSDSEITSYDFEGDAITVVEKSAEFNSYKKECIDLASHIKKIIKRTSKSDMKRIVELYKLYQGNPERYKELFEYQIKSVVGKDSVFFIKKVTEVYKEKQKLIKYLNSNKVVDNDRIYISGNLMRNMYSETLKKKTLISRVKTRVEDNSDDKSPCERDCEEDRDIDLQRAQDVMACETAVNVAVCLFTAGGSALASWFIEFGIAFEYDNAVRNAWADYERCMKRCE